MNNSGGLGSELAGIKVVTDALTDMKDQILRSEDPSEPSSDTRRLK